MSQTPAARYSRQVLFPPIGAEGQARLATRRVAILGAGALGASLGELLARAGVGTLRIVDRDIVEESNLGRQALYTAEDAAQSLPKAVALAGHLSAFNPEITIEPRVADLNAATAAELLDDVDLLIDGSDNFDTRYLVNDWCVKHGIPWIYGGCIAARGMSVTILPGETPCLACLFPEAPAPGTAETCDTAGIIAPAATIVASLQAVEALKLLVDDRASLRRGLLSIELWPFRLVQLGERDGPSADCAVCGRHEFRHLDGADTARTLSYCGRDAVQIVPGGGRGEIDLDALEARLSGHLETRRLDYVLRIEAEGHGLVVFADGRALVTGTGDAARARALYDRVIGG